MTNNQVIEALSKGLLDGGCKYTSNFPGFKSHEIFFSLGGKEISINERVAYEMAFGASLAGKRSVVSFKGSGMNFAADDYLHSVINGINAGLVCVLTDDIEAVSSPERQDSRPYFDLFGGLWLEPTSVQQAYDFGYDSLRWSEELDVPIVIRLTNQFFKLEGSFVRKESLELNISIENRREKYVSYWKKRQDNLNLKNQKIASFVESLYSPSKSSKQNGTIIFGNCLDEISNLSSDQDSLFLYTLPLPKKLISNFCNNKVKLTVIEQGRAFVSDKIKQDLSNRVILSNTGAYKDQSGAWTVFNSQEKLFKALSNTDPSFVVGDEGTFTDESTKTIDTCLCMGSSIGITAGLAVNGVKFPWCVTGDASFNLTGYQSITEAKAHNLNMGIIVFDNGMAKSTGGQRIVGDIRDITGVNKIDTAYEQTSEQEYQEILEKMKNTQGISILYIKVK